MIFNLIFDGFASIINFLVSLLPSIPQMPTEITSFFNSVLDMIFNTMDLFEFFIPFELVGILLPLAIIVSNLNLIWGLIRLVYRLIPIVGQD